MDKTIDNSLVLQSIASYLVWAKDFFWKNKNIFNVALIPDMHHVYTWVIKATWYRLLKKCDSLVLIWDSAMDDKIFWMKSEISVFMWKKWNLDKNIVDILAKSKITKAVDHTFDWLDYELPFLRVISEYKNLMFMEIWEKVDKASTLKLLKNVSKNANIMFVSDFNKNEDSFSSKIFFDLAKKSDKKPKKSPYLNIWDLSLSKDDENQFSCMFF